MKTIVMMSCLIVLSLSLFACRNDETVPIEESVSTIEGTPSEETSQSVEKTPEDVLFTITFETNSDTEIGPLMLEAGASLDEFEPEKDGYAFKGWYATANFTNRIWVVPAHDATVYAFFELDSLPDWVRVGEVGTTYSIPIGTFGGSTNLVEGGYSMTTTLTTYELWYTVRTWAEANGYQFANPGREGSHGETGHAPSAASQEPVTMVNWRDVIVWLNALSEMQGLAPVYRDGENDIIRDSRGTNAAVVDAVIQTDNNGYRLPTSREWEMAARWKNDTESTDGSIEVGGRWWTPGDYASGATANYENEAATMLVAWYWVNSKPDNFEWRKTQPVGQLTPNHLGLYDMSGNVYEFTFTRYTAHEAFTRIVRGGSYSLAAAALQVGDVRTCLTRDPGTIYGFRIVRDP